MITDGIRLLQELVEHPRRGVNALLPLVPREVTDAPPPPVTLYDELRHGWVARYQFDDQVLARGPALLLAQYAELDLPATGEQILAGTQALFALTYVDTVMRAGRPAATASATASYNAWQTLRCAVASVVAPFRRAPGPKPFLARNGVKYFAPELARYLARQPTPGSDVVVRVAILAMTADDPWLRGVGAQFPQDA